MLKSLPLVMIVLNLSLTCLGADVAASNPDGPTRALELSILEFHMSFLSMGDGPADKIDYSAHKKCFDDGIDPDFRGKDDMTLLHHCVALGQIEGVKLLLECGADPNNINKHTGQSILDVADAKIYHAKDKAEEGKFIEIKSVLRAKIEEIRTSH